MESRVKSSAPSPLFEADKLKAAAEANRKADAEAIVNDPTAQKPAVLLCWRLCKSRGHDLPVSNATAKRRDVRTAGLEELRERRVQEAVRAAGGRT